MPKLPTLRGEAPVAVNLSVSGSIELEADQWYLADQRIGDEVSAELTLAITQVAFKRNKEDELILNVSAKATETDEEDDTGLDDSLGGI